MRIGLTCTSIEPLITSGKIDGIGTYTKNLYETFLRQNLDVTPFSFPKSKLCFHASNFSKGKKFILPYPIATFVSFMTQHLYSGIDKHVDILHATDHMIPRIKKIPVVATLHDALMFKEPNWYVYAALKNIIKRNTMGWPNHFITVSKTMVFEITKYLGIPEEKISVVYNGISKDWLQKINTHTKLNILKEFKIPKNFLLFTATLQPKKNLPRLIEAYLQLPQDIIDDYPLIIVGKAGWKTEESLIAIQKLVDKKAGRWIQYVSKEVLQVLYQSATLYLHPSLHEGFGLTILESFASGTPVITSNITAMPEVAGDAAYLVDPYSISEIKQAIKNLLSNETARNELIEKGFERVKEFSLEKSAQETYRVYQNVLSKPYFQATTA